MTDKLRDAAQALLPCPFCGNSKNIAMANTHHDHSGGYYIGCPECGASTEPVFALMDDPRQILMEKWNRRADLSTPQPAADERLLRLSELLHDYGDTYWSNMDSAPGVQQSDVDAAHDAVICYVRALLGTGQQDATLTDERIKHLWDTRVGELCAKYPLMRTDILAFACAIIAAMKATP